MLFKIPTIFDFSIDMTINGERNECELQDLFLGYVKRYNYRVS